MNASVEFLPGPHAGSTRSGVAVSPSSAFDRHPFIDHTSLIRVQDGVLDIPGALELHHGGRLERVRVAWHLAGPAGAPVICALGGISAHRRVCTPQDSQPGWWADIAGADRPLDTRRYRILSFDYLGGSGDSTGPEASGSFPALSSYDQAQLLLLVLDHLQLRSLRAFVGSSYGGMVALAFGELYPDRVSQLIVIGAADRAHPMSTAWRSVQRRIVRFAIESGRPAEGLQLARALAMSTYRSPEEFAARFSAPPSRESEQFVFPVESYLFARGSDYATRYRPEAFLCLSESIDLHRVDASRIFVPTTAVGVREDQLVPLTDIRAMVARMPAARLCELSSVYGHDAFLKETEQLRRVFAAALENVS